MLSSPPHCAHVRLLSPAPALTAAPHAAPQVGELWQHLKRHADTAQLTADALVSLAGLPRAPPVEERRPRPPSAGGPRARGKPTAWPEAARPGTHTAERRIGRPAARSDKRHAPPHRAPSPAPRRPAVAAALETKADAKDAAAAGPDASEGAAAGGGGPEDGTFLHDFLPQPLQAFRPTF